MRKGFSLVEIIVSLSVIAIAISFSLPFFSRFEAGFILESLAKTITSEIRLLQCLAFSQHTDTSLNLGRLSIPPSIKISGKLDLRFSASGSPPPGGSGTILLENQYGRQKKIILSSAGRVRIE